MDHHRFSKRSLDNLNTVHKDLARVAHLALKYTSVDFVVTEGVRTLARQKELLASGASTTLNSRHLAHPSDGLSRALDVAAYVNGVRWDWPLYDKIAHAFKRAAAELKVPIVWGGDWKSFKDGPHFELDRRHYP